jgi:hypothetical protein
VSVSFGAGDLASPVVRTSVLRDLQRSRIAACVSVSFGICDLASPAMRISMLRDLQRSPDHCSCIEVNEVGLERYAGMHRQGMIGMGVFGIFVISIRAL